MKVSVIIPNYNGIKFLKVCLNSLNRQTFKHFETIIVDNGSSDGSCELIEESYPSIRLIRLPINYGFSKAVNEGIKTSTAEYVVLLNNDTEASPDWLENLINCIDKDATIFSCCSKMLQYNDKSLIDDAGDEYTILGWAYKRGDGFKSSSYSNTCQVFSSCGGAVVYRRRIFDSIGYLDEDFFAYMEDVDISYRAKIAGYKNIYCADAQLYHIGSATSGSKYNAFKVKLAARNNIYVVYKNMPLFQMILNSPFILTGFLIKALFFYTKGFGGEYVSGLAEGMGNLKNITKTKFHGKNLLNYVSIEVNMIINTFRYTFMKLRNKF